MIMTKYDIEQLLINNTSVDFHKAATVFHEVHQKEINEWKECKNRYQKLCGELKTEMHKDYIKREEIQPVLDVYKIYKIIYDNPNLIRSAYTQNMWQAIKTVAEKITPVNDDDLSRGDEKPIDTNTFINCGEIEGEKGK